SIHYHCRWPDRPASDTRQPTTAGVLLIAIFRPRPFQEQGHCSRRPAVSRHRAFALFDRRAGGALSRPVALLPLELFDLSRKLTEEIMAYSDVSLMIDGAWTKGANGRTIPVINPATEEVIGTVAH